jgi:hypothetical protein
MNVEALFYERHVRGQTAPGKVWVVGSKIYDGRDDWRVRWPDGVGIDMEAGDGVDVVADLTQPPAWRQLVEAHGMPAHVECRSVLEHCAEPWEFARLLTQWTVADCTLHIGVPFIWRVHNYPCDYWRFTPQGVRQLFGPRWQWKSLMLAVGPDMLVDVSDDKKVPVPVRHAPAGVPYFARAEVMGLAVRQ